MSKQQDLLQKASVGDAEAIAELIRQQRMGKMLRLYPGHRKGPEDEGVIPLLMDYEPECIRLYLGVPGKSFVVTESDFHIAVWLAKANSGVARNLFSGGMSEEDMIQYSNQLQTKGFSSKVEVRPQDNAFSLRFYPEKDELCLGLEGTTELVQKMTMAANELNWEILEDDDTRKVLAPYFNW